MSGEETKLPVPLGSFVGRQPEIDSLQQLINSGVRLITLTGFGGVGKTRLAIEIIRRVAPNFAGGTVFIPLETLDDSEQVLWAIARAVGVNESGVHQIFDDLCAVLQETDTLICLDNCEHVLEVAPKIAELLSACPDLHILATSREALRLREEKEFHVSTLDLPRCSDQRDSESVLKSPAVLLFVDRVRSLRPNFEVSEHNAAPVAEICCLLDGLPLALELGAAMLRLFSPNTLLARLKSDQALGKGSATMDLLSNGPVDLPRRQQTLRATIDWSYYLLKTSEQIVFSRLGVFAGGATIDGIEAVCLDPDLTPAALLSILVSLVDKNLLRADPSGAEERFYLLKTIQEYALEQLENKEETQSIRERHANYYLDFAEKARKELKGADQAKWLDLFELEHDNCIETLKWSLQQGKSEITCKMANVMSMYWTNRGYFSEGRFWFDKALAVSSDVPIELQIKVFNGLAIMAWYQCDYGVSRKFHTQCLELRRQINDRRGIANSLHNLGIDALRRRDNDAALACFQEGEALYREVGDLWGAADELTQIGVVLQKQKDFDGARKYIEQGWAMLREMEDTQGVAGSYLLLGSVAEDQALYDEARRHYSQGKSLFDEVGDLWGSAMAVYNLGVIALKQQDLREAEICFTNSLKTRSELGDKNGIAYCLEGAGCLAIAQLAPKKACQLLGAAEALREALGSPLDETEAAELGHFIHMAEAQIGEEAFNQAWNAGKRLRLDQATHYALQPTKREDRAIDRKGKGPSFPAGLTEREVEVLKWVALGLSDAEVSRKLVISPRTVNAHLTSIYSKIGVKSRAAATRFAIEKRLI